MAQFFAVIALIIVFCIFPIFWVILGWLLVIAFIGWLLGVIFNE